MWSYPALNDAVGATIYVKHENTQPTGAFKVRGGLTLLATMPARQRARGLITYSTGNHAQALAYASAVFDTLCTVVMPAAANEYKVRAVRALGSEVVLHGADLAAAQTYAESLAAERELALISVGDNPSQVAGVGTLHLEIVSAQPDLDAVIVPVGSGTSASAACLVAAELAPRCRVIAVQSSASPAGHDSWHSGSLVQRANQTVVEGLATGRGFDLPQRIMRRCLSDFCLVSDAQIAEAQLLLATHAHTLAEGAGAAALAAVLAVPSTFSGQRVAVVCSGGNANGAELAALGRNGSLAKSQL